MNFDGALNDSPRYRVQALYCHEPIAVQPANHALLAAFLVVVAKRRQLRAHVVTCDVEETAIRRLDVPCVSGCYRIESQHQCLPSPRFTLNEKARIFASVHLRPT